MDWAARTNKLGDLYDYDLRGAFKSGAAADERGHLTDQFKKPNHPTFSDQSQYHGHGGLEGGHWTQESDGSYSFSPGRTNHEFYSTQGMQRYFERNEPGNRLVIEDPLEPKVLTPWQETEL